MYRNIYVYEKSHHVILNITYHENSLDTVKNAYEKLHHVILKFRAYRAQVVYKRNLFSFSKFQILAQREISCYSREFQKSLC